MTDKELFKNTEKYIGQEITIEGWIKNHRKQKEFGFISFSDGTFYTPIQVVYDKDSNFDEIVKYHVGSAIKITGKVVESPKAGQDFEIHATNIELLGDCPEDYPIQPKKHTREFLREQAYLRPRTNLFQAVFRIRSKASFAIHKYFQDRDYVYFHAPLITASDAEGAGEMFKVTTLDFDKLPRTEDGKIDYSKDFFGRQSSLTVSGQLQAETFALAYKKTYTFGPTFRAENSNTKTHANEFWMIEPEIAFCDLEEDMNIMEDMLKYVVKYVLKNCNEELVFLDKFVEKGLIEKLKHLVKTNAVRITHEEAIKYLIESGKEFEFKPEYGEDLAREHEKYLTEEKFNAPVFVYDWPKDIKAFYMRLNDDNKTVAAVDLLVPGSGELMGGSQREERLDVLTHRMDELKMNKEELYWYIKLREYGGCVHSGFGMGFERLIMYLTGIENIRDVIPYPRTPGNCDF